MDTEESDSPPLLIQARHASLDQFENHLQARVPITLVTGYLGAGKTTLLNFILNEKHGKKIAVILNEFGDSSDIEKSLTVNQDGVQVQEWLELGNGCICCSIKDFGVNAIESLMNRRGAFDYILLETTGLADPGNIAPLFWVDDGLGSSIYLDGIVTLVDAKNIFKSLDDPEPQEHVDLEHHDGPLLTTAHLQISHADVIIINKVDLITSEELSNVEERIRSINGLAKIIITKQSKVSRLEGTLLDLHAYDDIEGLQIANKGHSHLDLTISTITIHARVLKMNEIPKVDEWLRAILWDAKLPGRDNETAVEGGNSFEIHRLKARLPMEDGSVKIVQGVREIFEIKDSSQHLVEGQSDPLLSGKLVIIGRLLEKTKFQQSFSSLLES